LGYQTHSPLIRGTNHTIH